MAHEIEGSFDWSRDGRDYEVQVGGHVTEVSDGESEGIVDFIIAPRLWVVRVYLLNASRERLHTLSPREWPIEANDLSSNETLRVRSEQALIEQYVDAKEHGCL